MGITRGHASRGHSVLSTHSSHNILKRRDKPYKSQKETVFAKKRKLHLQNSYERTAPPGYTFIPIGTPALAKKCKDLSRQRDYPVYVVNTEPRHINALDAQKVSAHVHREGYHFKAEVVTDACDELGFQFIQGKFRSQEEVSQLNYNSAIAQAMAKRGLQWTAPTASQETPERVQAAIRELFPRIPDHDLNAIVNHSWAAGTDRVGNNPALELPRRVQLAVIARIRHVYTDYDSLLKAMGDWVAVRKIVEPECLAKLLEWRGDNQDDDGQFEQMVRETIILDDDSDHETISSSDDDEEMGSSADEERLRRRNANVLISHRLAVGDDLRPEDPTELQRSRIPSRPQFQTAATHAAPVYRLTAVDGPPLQPAYLAREDQKLQPAQLAWQYTSNAGSRVPHTHAENRNRAPLIPVSQACAEYRQPVPQSQHPAIRTITRYHAAPTSPSTQLPEKSYLRSLPPSDGATLTSGEPRVLHRKEPFLSQGNYSLSTGMERPVQSIERADDVYHTHDNPSTYFDLHPEPSRITAAPHPIQAYRRIPEGRNEDMPATGTLRMVPVMNVEEDHHSGYVSQSGAHSDINQRSKPYMVQPLQHTNATQFLGEYGDTRLRPIALDGATSPPFSSAQAIRQNSRPESPVEYDPRNPLLWPPRIYEEQPGSQYSTSRHAPYSARTAALPSASYPVQNTLQNVASSHSTPKYRLQFVEGAMAPPYGSPYGPGETAEQAHAHRSYPGHHTLGQRFDTSGHTSSQAYPRPQQVSKADVGPYQPTVYPQKQTPKPIHGAPAVVQQLPRIHPIYGQTRQARTNTTTAPVNGAPAPTQYYAPR